MLEEYNPKNDQEFAQWCRTMGGNNWQYENVSKTVTLFLTENGQIFAVVVYNNSALTYRVFKSV